MQSGSGFLMLGESLLHAASSFSCELEFHRQDPAMERAFGAAGPHWRDTPEMDAIARHCSVVYLIGRGGTSNAAESMIRAAAALLAAGGMGVKVESSGVAHSPRQWHALAANLDSFSAHDALVMYVAGGEIYSCGMHLLGLPDAITVGTDLAADAELLRVFTRYLYRETPVLRDGQTFAADAASPVYQVRRDRGIVYPADSLFTNPYGYWRLEPARQSRKRWWH